MRFVVPLLVVLYALCPFDLIPDVFVGPGWLDDVTLLGFLAWYLFGRKKRAYPGREGRYAGAGFESESAWQGGGRGADAEAQPHGAGRRDPYRVLGVAPGASPDKIKKAYRELVSKYHPDKVSHLGEEFRDLAERRFKEIQEAYNKLASHP